MTRLEAFALLAGFVVVGGAAVVLGLSAIWARWNRDVALRHELERDIEWLSFSYGGGRSPAVSAGAREAIARFASQPGPVGWTAWAPGGRAIHVWTAPLEPSFEWPRQGAALYDHAREGWLR